MERSQLYSADDKFRRSQLTGMRSLFVAGFLLIAVVGSIIVSGMWIYNTSADTFALEQHIDLAQVSRDRIVRNRLANSSDAQAYAATHSRVFITRYKRHSQMFWQRTASLRAQLPRIDAQLNLRPIATEEAIYRRWQHDVAEPIFSGRAKNINDLLTNVDPRLSKAFLAQDTLIQNDLTRSERVSHDAGQRFLSNFLLARNIFIILAGTLVALLLWLRARSERQRLREHFETENQRRLVNLFAQSLAPDTLPTIAGIQLEAVYFPASQKSLVGGDWYEVIELGDDKILLVIGDVAGHGLDAALFMNRARQTITATAIVEHDPAALLLRANTALTKNTRQMVTVLCAVLNLRTGEFTYATAGHPPPLIATAQGTAELLRYGGPPLGVLQTVKLTTCRGKIEPGSTLFLFTDGLIENERNIVRGEERLIEAAARIGESEQAALTLYRALIGSDEPQDDVAILALHFAGLQNGEGSDLAETMV